MKKVFSVLAVAAMLLISFAGCNKDQTATQILTGNKGWVLSAAKSNPDYVMNDGSLVEDLINEGYLYDFEAAYIITFNENGNQTVKPGKVAVPADFDGDAYTAETSLGNWSFDNADNPTWIKMQVPFFYDDVQEDCKILTLTKDEFKISCTINDDAPMSKGTYSFILTSVPAK